MPLTESQKQATVKYKEKIISEYRHKKGKAKATTPDNE